MTNIKVYSRDDIKYRPVDLGEGLLFYQWEDNLDIIEQNDDICMSELTVIEYDFWRHKIMICASSKEAGKIYVVLNLRKLRDIKVLTKIKRQAGSKTLKTLPGKTFHGMLFRV